MLKAKASVKKDNTLRHRINELQQIARAPNKVYVGLPADSISYPDGTDLIMVAATNEFGSLNGNIPERSFIRSTVAERKKEYVDFWRGGTAKKLLKAEDSPKKALELLGQLYESYIKEKIVDISEPPNTEQTIARKGSSSPLEDIGLLKQSIRYEVSE